MAELEQAQLEGQHRKVVSGYRGSWELYKLFKGPGKADKGKKLSIRTEWARWLGKTYMILQGKKCLRSSYRVKASWGQGGGFDQ